MRLLNRFCALCAGDDDDAAVDAADEQLIAQLVSEAEDVAEDVAEDAAEDAADATAAAPAAPATPAELAELRRLAPAVRALLPSPPPSGEPVWIFKPDFRARGEGACCQAAPPSCCRVLLTDRLRAGISISTRLTPMLRSLHGAAAEDAAKSVVQHYITRPLLLHDRKFDIRQWVLITSVRPLAAHMFGECYLRFCSEVYTHRDYHDR